MTRKSDRIIVLKERGHTLDVQLEGDFEDLNILRKWKQILQWDTEEIRYFGPAHIKDILSDSLQEGHCISEFDDGDFRDFSKTYIFHDVNSDIYHLPVKSSWDGEGHVWEKWEDHSFRNLPNDYGYIKYPAWIIDNQRFRIDQYGLPTKTVDTKLKKLISEERNVTHIVRLEEIRGESSLERLKTDVYEISQEGDIYGK